MTSEFIWVAKRYGYFLVFVIVFLGIYWFYKKVKIWTLALNIKMDKLNEEYRIAKAKMKQKKEAGKNV